MIVSDKDLGIRRDKNSSFECNMTIPSYKHLIALIEPFTDIDFDGFNWLDELIDADSKIDFLLSNGGGW